MAKTSKIGKRKHGGSKTNRKSRNTRKVYNRKSSVNRRGGFFPKFMSNPMSKQSCPDGQAIKQPNTDSTTVESCKDILLDLQEKIKNTAKNPTKITIILSTLKEQIGETNKLIIAMEKSIIEYADIYKKIDTRTVNQQAVIDLPKNNGYYLVDNNGEIISLPKTRGNYLFDILTEIVEKLNPNNKNNLTELNIIEPLCKYLDLIYYSLSAISEKCIPTSIPTDFNENNNNILTGAKFVIHLFAPRFFISLPPNFYRDGEKAKVDNNTNVATNENVVAPNTINDTTTDNAPTANTTTDNNQANP